MPAILYNNAQAIVSTMYTPHKLFAVSVILGESLLSLTGDEVSALYKYMPPTPKIGSIASTKTTIPIPPNH